VGLISTLLGAYQLVLIAYVIAAWVPRMPEPLQPATRVVRRLVDPLLAPLRRLLPPLRLGGVGIDLSIIILFFAVAILQGIFASQGL
jgi:YggT family protein